MNEVIIQHPRKENGQFQRIRKPWSLKNFNDGFIDNKGRFRVWLPIHPRAYKSGYILRAVVAYEVYNNISVPKDYDIHHIDHNCINDSKENLQMMKHGEHTTFHQKKIGVKFICKTCEKEFFIPKWRESQRIKEGKSTKFSSLYCFHKRVVSEETKKKHSIIFKSLWATKWINRRKTK